MAAAPFRFLARLNATGDGYELLDGTPESASTKRAAGAASKQIEDAGLDLRQMQAAASRVHRFLVTRRETRETGWSKETPFLQQGAKVTGGYASQRTRQKATRAHKALADLYDALPAVPSDPALQPIAAALKAIEAIRQRPATKPHIEDGMDIFARRYGRLVHRMTGNMSQAAAVTLAVMRACYPTDAASFTAGGVRKRIDRWLDKKG